jgi:two-component system, sensor histidine kinase and response regulator
MTKFASPQPSEHPVEALKIVDTPRFRAILIAAIGVLIVSLYFLADRLALRTEQDALHRLAKSHAELIISFRNFYSSRLLPIVRQHSQLAITHDYKSRQGALPIPATMTIDLVDEIAKSNPEMNLRLVSPYPFPWRKTVLDAFESDALAALQASGKNEFLRIEQTPRGKVLRYAAPIRLEKSCVGCHNSHPDSPKRDWKEGDVRGVQVMALSLEGLSFDNHPQHYLFATILLIAFGLAGGALLWMHGRNVRAVRLAQANAEGMHDRQRALDAHAIVSITDRAGRILYANEKFCAISGYGVAELIGQNHRILKSGMHPDSFYAEMWATISSGETWEGEICNKKKNGDIYWVKSTVVPFLDERGNPAQYIAIRTDITARKAVETELIGKRAEAEAASRAKSDFLANMSHEIRTPMNGIIGMTDLALDTNNESERHEYMTIVKNSAESLLGILNDILDFSKIEANKLMIEQVGFELRQVVAETLKTLGVRASEKGLELICDFTEDVPNHVLGDPTRVRQVLINLVGNAIKFTNEGEIVVSVTVEALSDRSVTLLIAVRDSGIGIPPDKLDSIFEAFSQADASTTRQYGGTGLGLSISSRLVELMGGHMSVDSTLGKGSTFHFTLVLGVDEQPVTPLATEQLAGKQVLVIDDNAVNREIFLRQLTQWGMHALAVGSAAAAQALCHERQGQFDLVVLDQHMPDMDGLALASWMRDQASLASTPMLMLSSGPLKEDAERARNLDLRGYLTKPVTDIDFLTAVKRALGMAEPCSDDGHSGAPAPGITGRILSVLLVEDNPINQQLAIRLLEKWGHRITLAVDGQEAVSRLCLGEHYDIVLMDMQMPVMGGIEATRRIRAHEAEHGTTRVPIVAMTANAMLGDRELCLAAGMDDYLSKPINQVELAAKLRMFSSSEGADQAGVMTESPALAQQDCLNESAFDYAAGVSAMDAEIVEILAPAFLDLYQGDFDNLRRAIDHGDTQDAMRRAHSLKGTLAAFGARPAERCAAKMEVLANAGDLPALAPLLRELETEIGKLVAVLRQ